MITATELAERMKTEIKELVAAGTIPASAASFADLHSYVDANCLGGSDELFGDTVSESDSDAEHQAKLDAFSAVFDPAMNAVDAWIKGGGLREMAMAN